MNGEEKRESICWICGNRVPADETVCSHCGNVFKKLEETED